LEVWAFRAKGEEAPWRSLQLQLEEGTAAIPWNRGRAFLLILTEHSTLDSLEILDLPQIQTTKIDWVSLSQELGHRGEAITKE